jgi:hypothetical protein
MTGILVSWSAILQTKMISARSLEQSVGARIQIGIGPARQATWADGINSLESIPGLLKRLQIRTLVKAYKKDQRFSTLLNLDGDF